MTPIGRALLAFVASLFRSRLSLQLETVALRHQLTLYQRSIRRPRVCPTDRILPTVGFKVVFVLAVLAYARRKVVHFNVATHPTAQVTVFSEGHLRRLLTSHFHYYHRARTHSSLAMDCPDIRPVQPPDQGAVVAFPEVGGLHHHYERMAA